mgnify:CR=1 FL=1
MPTNGNNVKQMQEIERKEPFPSTWSKGEPKLDAQIYQYNPHNRIMFGSQDNKHWWIEVDTEFQFTKPDQYKFTGTWEDARRHAICLATKIDIFRDQWQPAHLKKFGYNSINEFAEKKYQDCLQKFKLSALK